MMYIVIIIAENKLVELMDQQDDIQNMYEAPMGAVNRMCVCSCKSGNLFLVNIKFSLLRMLYTINNVRAYLIQRLNLHLDELERAAVLSLIAQIDCANPLL